MFHLSFDIPPAKVPIQLSSSLVTIGSCFAESMGNQLLQNKFNVLTNPFGTIYNPVSLAQLLTDDIQTEAIIESQGVYFHWQAHGEVSALSARELQTIMAMRRRELQERLQTTDWLIITLGSAFAYRLKSDGRIVANCHKMPQSEFSKELLTAEEMTLALKGAIAQLETRNPKLKTLLTVSPVRHIRDGLVENNRSKARLIEVAHTLTEQLPHVSYFPAYEILIDELRDYRFYSTDRVHPSEEAVAYIWERFADTYFDASTEAFMNEWQAIRSAIQHRPFHVASAAHQQFLRKTLDRLNQLADKVDVQAEVSLLQKQLL